MKELRHIVGRNILARPARSILLALIAAVLSAAVFDGTLVMLSMHSALAVMEQRLGADIMVVPYEVIMKTSFDGKVLQGVTGNYYMDGGYPDEIAQTEGIGQISAQYYMTSAELECCEEPVHIIGYDPETDFTVSAWIAESAPGTPGAMEAVIGHSLDASCGDTLILFGEEVKVAAKLDRTGTDYDCGIFVDMQTIRALTEASGDERLAGYLREEDGGAVSCVLIRTAPGYSPEDVKNDINIHFRKLRAIRSEDTAGSIASGMGGMSAAALILTAAVWVTALGILAAASFMVTRERGREYGVLRAMGADRRRLVMLALCEGAAVSLAGGAAGLAAGAAAMLPVSGILQEKLGIPFLLPGSGQAVLCGLLALLVTAGAGAAAAAAAAYRIVRQDTGMILRGSE